WFVCLCCADIVFFFICVIFFFFQAEDGIRDSSVTGVQTCALPIFLAPSADQTTQPVNSVSGSCIGTTRKSPVSGLMITEATVQRSEERRVGKECSCRWGR